MSENSQGPRCHLCLVVMCGLPGVGKTTLTERLVTTRNIKNSTCCSSNSADTYAPAVSDGKDLSILLLQFDDIIPRDLPIDSGGTAILDTYGLEGNNEVLHSF